MGYNTNLVKAEEAPKSFKDLLDPKWSGKIVKAHPSYSGTILTATYQVSRDIGWDYFENLAKQKIMQVQSASDPPKKLALGERALMADGIEYGMFQIKEKGQPVELIYPSEGTPLIVGPNAVFKAAPNPNAARLLQAWMFTPECQQLCIDFGGLRSAHALTKEKPGRKPLKDIKLMKDDAVAVEKQSEAIKKRYTQIFKV
jgi:iron(III) transport system substrate-binding protein